MQGEGEDWKGFSQQLRSNSIGRPGRASLLTKNADTVLKQYLVKYKIP